MQPILTIENLKTHFLLDEGTVRAVDGVSLSVPRGKTLCVVGESGSGKSVTAYSVLRLIDAPGRIVDGRVILHRSDAPGKDDVDLTALDAEGPALRAIRGNDIAMIFQEPMTALSPVHTVGDQVRESIELHTPLRNAEAKARILEILRRVGIPNPERRYDEYPHQLSGGLRQRVVIAIALACEPMLLIADEPTTALDVTIQAQILELLAQLQREMGMAILLITHDLGVVAQIADEVAVMYMGQVVERAPVLDLFEAPQHPYTRALLASIPTPTSQPGVALPVIRGSVPDPLQRLKGCPFHPRCESAIPGRCDQGERPVLSTRGDGHPVACLLEEAERGR